MTKQPKGEEKFVLEEIVSILRDKAKKKISGLGGRSNSNYRLGGGSIRVLILSSSAKVFFTFFLFNLPIKVSAPKVMEKWLASLEAPLSLENVSTLELLQQFFDRFVERRGKKFLSFFHELTLLHIITLMDPREAAFN